MNVTGAITPKHPSGFMALPSTRLGTWSAWLLVVALVLVLANNLIDVPARQIEVVNRLANLTAFLAIVATGATGAVAILSKHERSWVAFLAVAFLVFALAMNLGAMLFP